MSPSTNRPAAADRRLLPGLSFPFPLRMPPGGTGAGADHASGPGRADRGRPDRDRADRTGTPPPRG